MLVWARQSGSFFIPCDIPVACPYKGMRVLQPQLVIPWILAVLFPSVIK